MLTNTTQKSSKTSIKENAIQPSDNNEEPKRIESLVKISSSSKQSSSTSPCQNNSEVTEVERIVKKTLQQLQGVCQFEDLESLANILVPKVLFSMHSFERLSEEVKAMKQSFDCYVHHTKVLGEDIAEIFLDLHNIYSKLDKLDKQHMQQQRDTTFTKRVRAAQEFLRSTRHYIVNDNGTTNSLTTANQTPDTELEGDGECKVLSHSETKSAERKAFLANMVVAKKSDFSLKLNRNKNFYSEAERLLNIENSDKEDKN
ncbi:uncharacterized protein LOC6562126 [Drosophila grimshawi]|uniref:GH10902 n=1 Tax=Drosophila grimshawi TaxID=7222 RepID=B4JAU8_DROGR|nr:uncharacterized protein LOC6562126 [Drosophila grimshawi]EDW02818.1 GH10902 [Drosophila grimshawi]